METIFKIVEFFKKNIRGVLAGADLLSLAFAFGAAATLKFGGVVLLPDWFVANILWMMGADFVITAVFFLWRRIYSRMWQFFVYRDYGELMLCVFASQVLTTALFFNIWTVYTRDFFTYMSLTWMIFLLLTIMVRAGMFITYRGWRSRVLAVTGESKKKNILIIGAGGAAHRLITELRGINFVNRYRVVGLIDDNVRKKGEYLDGVRVYGGRDVIQEVVRRLDVDEIYFAVPSASETDKKEILGTCNKTGCVLKTLPRIADVTVDGSLGAQLRKVDYTDLLGREPIKADLTGAFAMLKDRVVLVTGGGGSIGGELVRQIAASGVTRQLLIFDIAENGAYELEQEIRRNHPDVNLHVLIGSVRDKQRLEEIFAEYHPDYVYHAAAHKHVPLMEDNPKEAVKNNVLGTYNLAMTADRFGVKRFVMISTDKAVNPTNVMGASKRICEKIVQAYNSRSDTDFVCVRFGNVLGSSGSVIPLFKEQIEAGGPVTVTHPDIIRYFMMIPEAVSLVLQAGAYAKGGEIFILDMGQPVKIRELAENLIRLSGHVPGEDIEIKYTGLREGEKLYEELLIGEEGIQKTENNLIYVAKPTEIDGDALFAKVNAVADAINGMSHTETIDWIKSLVPNFTPKNTEYNEAKHE